MMTKTLIATVCALGTLMASAYAQDPSGGQKPGLLVKERAPFDDDASVELVEFKGGGISVKYPVGWEALTDVPKPRVLHVKTMGGRVNASVTVQEVPSGTTLDGYRDATIRDISTDAKDLKPQKISEEKTHLGEMDAYKLIYSIKVPNTDPPISAKQTLYVAVKNNKGYLLCCTAFDALPGKFDSVFRSMADSITTSDVDSSSGSSSSPSSSSSI